LLCSLRSFSHTREEDGEFKASLGYIVRPYQNIKQNKKATPHSLSHTEYTGRKGIIVTQRSQRTGATLSRYILPNSLLHHCPGAMDDYGRDNFLVPWLYRSAKGIIYLPIAVNSGTYSPQIATLALGTLYYLDHSTLLHS
jgi:hypothetical protein